MIQVHYTEDLEKGDEVLADLNGNGIFSKYYVRDIVDQFVGLDSTKYSKYYSYWRIGDIEVYNNEQT